MMIRVAPAPGIPPPRPRRLRCWTCGNSPHREFMPSFNHNRKKTNSLQHYITIICEHSNQQKNMNAPEFPQILLDVKSRVEDLICGYVLDTMKNGTLSRGRNLSFPPEFVERVKSMKSGAVEKEVYNYCLCNHYRNGEEYMGYHADDEGSLDPHTPIASVSFGVTRSFDIRARKKKKNGDAGGRPRLARIALGDGDLLLMFPPMQDHYEYSIPVEKRAAGERINLTFRRITTSTT